MLSDAGSTGTARGDGLDSPTGVLLAGGASALAESLAGVASAPPRQAKDDCDSVSASCRLATAFWWRQAMAVSESVPGPQVFSNFLGLQGAPGQLVRPLRTSGNVGIGTTDTEPQASLEVRSAEGFDRPQVQIAQSFANDFARLRFVSTILSAGNADEPHPPTPTPATFWDIAVGGVDQVMNLFHQRAGNILTLTPRGNVGIGVPEPVARLHVDGAARVAVLEITGGTDLAEAFAVDAAKPGDVVVIDEDRPGRLRVCERRYDRKVAGIVSGAGGLACGVMLGADDGAGQVPIALSGRAWCKADARTEPIAPGDLLTTADCPGHAMKAVDEQAARGAILGKAMSRLDAGQGLVLALVNLQ
jgi:hypothetical protein